MFLYSFFSKMLIDDLQKGNINRFHILCVIWIVFIIAIIFAIYIFPIYTVKGTYKVFYEFIKEILTKLIKTPYNVYVNKFTKADVIERLKTDLAQVANSGFGFISYISGIFVFLLITIWGFSVSVYAMSFLILCSLVEIRVENIFNKRIEKEMANLRTCDAEASQNLYDLITNTEVLVVSKVYLDFFNLYKQRRYRLWNANKTIDMLNLKNSLFISLMNTFVDCGMLVLLYLMGMKNFVSIFLASIFLFSVWKESYRSLSLLMSSVAQNKPVIDRVDELTQYARNSDKNYQVAFIDEPGTKNIIEINNLCFEADGRKILEDVNICIKEGEKVAIIGKNGSGKTTLLRIMMGLNSYTDGRVSLKGIDPMEIPLEERVKLISYIPAMPQLFGLSIRQNLELGSSNGINEKRLKELLEVLYLKEWIDSLVSDIDTDLNVAGQNVSGGQAQRISIARALIEERDLVFADEPASMLDDKMSQEVFDFILEKSKTFIYVTHKIEQVKKADKVILVNEGNAKFVDKLEDVEEFLEFSKQ